MNLFVKLMLFGLVLAVAGPFFMKGSDGQPLMNIKDFIPEKGDFAGGGATDQAAETLGSGKTRFYKWKDENGIWQMSDTPPPEGILPKDGVEELVVNANANVIQSMSTDKIDRALGRESTSQQSNWSSLEQPKEDTGVLEEEGLSLTTVPLTKIPQLIKEAQGVKDIMSRRDQALQRL